MSGSGTATAVSLGSVAWPILQRAGYPREQAGGMLAAAGIGAILSPPTLGAAAFIIAEYVGVPYLQVLLWAMIPTLLYYLGILLAVEIDARRFGHARPVDVERDHAGRAARPLRLPLRSRSASSSSSWRPASRRSARWSTRRSWPPCSAWSSELLARTRDRAASIAHAALRTTAPTIYHALAVGIRSVLAVAAVCAAAGIIISVIAKTGLGQQLADLLVRRPRRCRRPDAAVLIADRACSRRSPSPCSAWRCR